MVLPIIRPFNPVNRNPEKIQLEQAKRGKAWTPSPKRRIGMNWTQVYNPLGNLALSALVAGIPLYILFYMLAVRRSPGHWAALFGTGFSGDSRDFRLGNAGRSGFECDFDGCGVWDFPNRVDRVEHHMGV